MVYISDTLISLAKDLKAQKDERIKDLVENGPRAFYEQDELFVVLLREGEERYIRFGEHSIEFVSSDKDEDRHRYCLVDPPDEDGFTYFFLMRKNAIWVSKAEWLILQKNVEEANRKEFGL
jgi:hypothetical protein